MTGRHRDRNSRLGPGLTIGGREGRFRGLIRNPGESFSNLILPAQQDAQPAKRISALVR
jgi:hypothetical protein